MDEQDPERRNELRDEDRRELAARAVALVSDYRYDQAKAKFDSGKWSIAGAQANPTLKKWIEKETALSFGYNYGELMDFANCIRAVRAQVNNTPERMTVFRLLLKHAITKSRQGEFVLQDVALEAGMDPEELRPKGRRNDG